MAKTPTFNSIRQQLVNRVFSDCMAMDKRSLAELQAAVRERVRHIELVDKSRTQADRDRRHEILHAIDHWAPSNHELQIMISRNAMGEGEWAYYPAYTTPPRYVSRVRIHQLVQRMEQKTATERERDSLKLMLEDLTNGERHWRRKHAQARQKAEELRALKHDITIRAFDGHYGELV